MLREIGLVKIQSKGHATNASSRWFTKKLGYILFTMPTKLMMYCESSYFIYLQIVVYWIQIDIILKKKGVWDVYSLCVREQ